MFVWDLCYKTNKREGENKLPIIKIKGISIKFWANLQTTKDKEILKKEKLQKKGTFRIKKTRR
jgi:hypothetical protein